MTRTRDVNLQPPNYPPSRHVSHSFSHSPSVPQIFSYLCIVAELLIYFLCLHQKYQNYILMAFYILFGILMIIAAAVCSCTNPTDKIIYYYKWSKIDKNVAFTIDYTNSCYCEYCDSFCGLKSKHCRICNRCASNFDHHCVWINNCVGDDNYKSFFALIIFTFCHFALFLTAGAIMSSSVQKQRQNLSFLIPVWVLMGVIVIMQILLIQLIVLHIYLLARGVTTYQFLQERRKAEQDEKRREEKEAKDRTTKIQQSDKSNSNIKALDSVKIQISKKKDENENEHENENENENENKETLSMHEVIKVQSQSKEQDYEYLQQKQENQGQFKVRNKKLKAILGYTQVDSPKKSKKRLKPLS